MKTSTHTRRHRILLATAIVSTTLVAGYAIAQSQMVTAMQHPAVRYQPDANGPPPSPPQPPPPAFGGPLPGLTNDQMIDFANGLGQFKNVETVASGLGPIFNGSSCLACHSKPVVGGSSNIVTTRFGRTVDGVFDPLTSLGGSLLQDKAIAPGAMEFIPKSANTIAHRQTMALFGDGLIEAIPDATILANAARSQTGGLHGLPAMIVDVTTGKERVGRFGWKAQQATLLAFAADAFVNEMGITNRYFPTENAPNGNLALLAKYDHVADPEDTTNLKTGKAGIDRAADYMRYLAPPPPRPMGPQQLAGQALFQTVGCSGCHTPVMQTGPNSVAALDRKPVFLYSDLLLHDMGSLNDGIAQGFALGSEMKTPALWGVGASGPWLHDGRAATLDQAIRLHDGEGKASKNRYVNLPEAQKQQLLAFLNSI